MIASRMPTLEAFAAQSLTFSHARSVFPSMTRVATTSFATGQWPNTHGIVNNAFHQPDLVQGAPVNTADFANLSQLKSAQGHAVTATSLGHALAANGLRMGTVHCGTPGAAFLINHAAASLGHSTFSVYGEEATQTPQAFRDAVARFGPLPAEEAPKFDTLRYAARVFCDTALTTDGPEVALLWLSEPDTSYHRFGIGSDEANAVTAAADRAFAEVLEAAEYQDGRTAIIVLSDHGQITMTYQTDITAEMQADGLPASHAPGADHRLALTQGNMGELRSLDGDQGLIAGACDWLMARADIGMVFARDDVAEALPGSLPMSRVHHGHARSPELFFLMRSSDAPDQWGLPGTGGLIAGVARGGGMHGGLNRHEMATTLIVQAPEGRRGVDATPVGLVDLAPTICALLGLEFPCPGAPLPLFDAAARTVTSEVFRAGRSGFAQALHQSIVDGRAYLDYGGRE